MIVVSTHLDDAVFSCFSVLSPETLVVTVLAGAPPHHIVGYWDVEGGTTDSHGRVLERRREDEHALQPSGSRHLHLDFADSQYVGDDALPAPTHEALVAGLTVCLDPAAVVYAPAGIWNTDHKSVRDAVLALRPDAVLYADIPYALHPGMGGFELPAEIAAAGRQRREVLLDDDRVALKLESSSRYVTQLAQLTRAYGEFLNTDGLRREVFWELA